MKKKQSRIREEQKASIWSRMSYVMLLAIPAFGMIAYGLVDAWALSLAFIMTAVMLLMRIADGFQSGSFKFNTSLLQVPLIGLILLACFQLLPLAEPLSSELIVDASRNSLSLDPYATRFWLIKAAMILVYFSTALVEINTKQRAKMLMFGIVIFGAVMAFFGIAQELVDPGSIYGLRPTPQAVSFGPFVNRHHFAGFMEMTLGITLSILLCGGTKPNKRTFLIFAAALMGIAVLMISSRGGMLSVAGVTAFVAAASFLIKRKNAASEKGNVKAKLTVAAAAIAVILGIFGTVVFLGSGDAIVRGIGASETADVSNGRFHFWTISGKIIAANPIIGVGFDAFGSAFTKFDTWNGTFRIEQAHNDYIQTLTDGGIIGFAFVVMFIWLFLKTGLRNITSATEGFHRSAVIGSFAGCLGIMIHSFFDFPLRTNSNLFFFMLLVSIVILPNALFLHRTRSELIEPLRE